MKKQTSTFEKRKNVTENSYINGVLSSDKTTYVIRPLNKEEKEFLEKFNKEYGEGRFNDDETDLHYDLIVKHEEEVTKLKKEKVKLGKRIKEIKSFSGWRKMNSEERKDHKAKLEERNEEIRQIVIRRYQIAERLAEIDIKGSIYKDDKNRSHDPLNFKNRLVYLSDLVEELNCSDATLLEHLSKN